MGAIVSALDRSTCDHHWKHITSSTLQPIIDPHRRRIQYILDRMHGYQAGVLISNTEPPIKIKPLPAALSWPAECNNIRHIGRLTFFCCSERLASASWPAVPILVDYLNADCTLVPIFIKIEILQAVSCMCHGNHLNRWIWRETGGIGATLSCIDLSEPLTPLKIKFNLWVCYCLRTVLVGNVDNILHTQKVLTLQQLTDLVALAIDDDLWDMTCTKKNFALETCILLGLDADRKDAEHVRDYVRERILNHQQEMQGEKQVITPEEYRQRIDASKKELRRRKLEKRFIKQQDLVLPKPSELTDDQVVEKARQALQRKARVVEVRRMMRNDAHYPPKETIRYSIVGGDQSLLLQNL